MRNVTAGPVTGSDLFGRDMEIRSLWRSLEAGEHVLMLAPYGTGKSSLMLALTQNPRPRWDVVYTDLQAELGAPDLLAALLRATAFHPAFRTWTFDIPLGAPIKQALAQTIAGGGRVPWQELRRILSRNWQHSAALVHAALRRLPQPTNRLLVILDELPYLMARILIQPEGNAEAEAIGQWLQAMQDDPRLEDRVHFLFSGSSGLENVLRQLGLTRHDGRVAAFSIDTWSREAAHRFLAILGLSCAFPLSLADEDALLDMLGELVPQHVQLLFSALRKTCDGDPKRVTNETLDAAFEEAITGTEGAALFEHYADLLKVIFRQRERGVVHYCLNRLSPHRDGLAEQDVRPQDYGLERPFPLIIRLLEEEGYIIQERRRLRFRSNLVREWWRRSQRP